MKILEVKSLTFPEVKVIRYARFKDRRGYFTEVFRKSDFKNKKEIEFIKDANFVQYNESFSRKDTVRGFHFQWDPYIGKLVRVVDGNIIDMIIDIRKNSPSYGKIIGHPTNSSLQNDFGEWIWVPSGFAHGILYLKDTYLVYFCTGEYNARCEASISPFAPDINWSFFDQKYMKMYKDLLIKSKLISDKDRAGFSLTSWQKNPNSDNFIYGKI